jgi:homoserine dehydrogenase
MSPPVTIGLLGCGTVGSGVVRLLTEHADEIAGRLGARLVVGPVAVRNTALDREPPVERLTSDPMEVVDDPEVDIVVEVMGGIEPARGLISAALERGKPVVTANKELVATLGAELFDLADAKGTRLEYEAAVAGGIPIIKPMRESLAGDRVRKVLGILNGTTNYILTKMTEEGVDFGEALAEAQRLGYAERDPAADIEGFDAAAKAAILASIAFDARVVAGDVFREGITRVTPSTSPTPGAWATSSSCSPSPSGTTMAGRSVCGSTPPSSRPHTPSPACGSRSTRSSSRQRPSVT